MTEPESGVAAGWPEFYRLCAAQLLPIHAVEVELKLLESLRLGFYHHAALRAFINHLLGDLDKQSLVFWVHAPESGRIGFERGESYRFQLWCAPGGEVHLTTVVDALGRPSSVQSDPRLRFNGRWTLKRLSNPLTLDPVDHLDQLVPYSEAAWQREVEAWRAQEATITQRLLTPFRMLQAQDRRQDAKGDARYVRDRYALSASGLFGGVANTLAELLRARGETTKRPPLPDLQFESLVSWVEDYYWSDTGQKKPVGGLIGAVHYPPGADFHRDILLGLVLGQYLGAGQRRGFGQGRYRLENPDGLGHCPAGRVPHRYLQQASRIVELEQAWRDLRGAQPAPFFSEAKTGDEAGFLDEIAADDDEINDLDELSQRLKSGAYSVPALCGRVRRQPGKAPRPLAVPPLGDRIVQRSVMNLLYPPLDALVSETSYGFRRGRSRFDARDRIQTLVRQGYCWFYEADIEDFFDHVPHDLLEAKLKSLLIDEPAVGLIMRWVRAPVEFEGQTIERPCGLPQGAPISPLLANLMLGDLDADLEALEMKLIRFADDFVILCKSREKAEQAAERVCRSLAEMGMEINPDKTRIGSVDRGFRFLGFVFVNDLAVETGKPVAQAPQPLSLESLPPDSWLALFARKNPERLQDLAEIPGPSAARPEAERRTDEPIESGQIGEAGTTLYLAGEPARVFLRGGRLVVIDKEGRSREFPWQELAQIVVFGRHQLTTPVLLKALSENVPIHFSTRTGHYRGLLNANTAGAVNHLLWQRQAKVLGDPRQALVLARNLVDARLANQRQVLRQRKAREDAEADHAIRSIARCRDQVSSASDLQQLHGFEGSATALYFRNWARLLPEPFEFDGRNRRPPRDPVNALLSLGYTVLYQHTDTLIRTAGLSPWIGVYHQPHGSHAVLASDLMENYRHLVEQVTLAVLNRGQIAASDFDHSASGVRLSSKALATYLQALTARLDMPAAAAGGDRARTIYQHIETQIRMLTDVINGKGEFNPYRIR
jgi:CRISPR-associated endonuclease Cas1/group II intron reverse transcriptase/maturase